MKILITGGSGFVGGRLAQLASTDPTLTGVRVLDDLSTGTAERLRGVDVDFVEGSILDETVLNRSVRGCDALIHLAALPSVPRSVRDPVASHHANATGTLQVLQAARRYDVRHVVVASSSSVYGGNPALPKKELAWTRPLSPYAVTKLATEAYTLAFQSTYGLPALAFRLFNVYGPGQRHDHAYAAVIPRFVYAALRGEPASLYGDGHQSRDFTYVDTVCAVILDAVRRGVTHAQPVNLAFGARLELLEVLAELELILGGPVAVNREEPRASDMRHSSADSSLLHRLFPEVLPVSFTDGLRRTVDWFARNVVPQSSYPPAPDRVQLSVSHAPEQAPGVLR